MIGPPIATFTRSNGPLVATAIHAGSYMRNSLLPYCELDRYQRLREEDPFTEHLAKITENRIIGERSRFEVDLNRPRDKAVYMRPEDAWGLKVYTNLPKEAMEASLAMYDAFYEETARMMDNLLREHKRLVVFDIHSYNHQRDGEGVLADPEANPEINIGTANLDREVWRVEVDELIGALRRPMANGRELDVRENVKFKGGYFSQWLHQRYRETVCAIAIEFKKIFMNEWTGVPDMIFVEQLRAHLEKAAVSVMKKLHGPPIH